MLSSIRRYYDANTRLFLRFGSSQTNQTIHRALWMEDTIKLEQALHTSHNLILAEAQTFSQPIKLLDLGCGVGATLHALLNKVPTANGAGITLSGVQAQHAMQHPRANILQADFHHVPFAPAFDLIYAIEAFIHATDMEQFFSEVARLLAPRGKLILIDDVRGKQNSKWIDIYQSGWHAPNLHTVLEIEAAANTHNLILTLDRDLTPYLHLRDLPDALAWSLFSISRPFTDVHPIVPSMIGSMALQQCLKASAIEYHMLVFQKTTLDSDSLLSV